MAAPTRGFDPLTDLAGLWTTELAERYLPIEGMPPAKYECLDGHLIMSQREGAWNSFGEMELGYLLRAPARGGIRSLQLGEHAAG